MIRTLKSSTPAHPQPVVPTNATPSHTNQGAQAVLQSGPAQVQADLIATQADPIAQTNGRTATLNSGAKAGSALVNFRAQQPSAAIDVSVWQAQLEALAKCPESGAVDAMLERIEQALAHTGQPLPCNLLGAMLRFSAGTRFYASLDEDRLDGILTRLSEAIVATLSMNGPEAQAMNALKPLAPIKVTALERGWSFQVSSWSVPLDNGGRRCGDLFCGQSSAARADLRVAIVEALAWLTPGQVLLANDGRQLTWDGSKFA